MAEKQDTAPKQGLGMMAWIAILVGLSVLAGGIGTGIGLVLLDQVAASAKVEEEVKEEAPEPVNYSEGEQLVALPAVTANLAQPREAWVRMEAGLVFASASAEARDVLVHEIAGDFLAYVRTLKLSQLQGAYGLMHLREDLTERAAIRSGGEVKEVIIHALVLE